MSLIIALLGLLYRHLTRSTSLKVELPDLDCVGVSIEDAEGSILFGDLDGCRKEVFFLQYKRSDTISL